MKKLLLTLVLMSSISLAQDVTPTPTPTPTEQPSPTPTPTPSPTPFVPNIPSPVITTKLEPINFYLDPQTTADLQVLIFSFLAQKGATIPTIPSDQMIQTVVLKKSKSDLSAQVSIYYTNYP